MSRTFQSYLLTPEMRSRMATMSEPEMTQFEKQVRWYERLYRRSAGHISYVFDKSDPWPESMPASVAWSGED